MTETRARSYDGIRYYVSKPGENLWNNREHREARYNEVLSALRLVNPSEEAVMNALAEGRQLGVVCGKPVYHNVIGYDSKVFKASVARRIDDDSEAKDVCAIVTFYTHAQGDEDANTPGILTVAENFEAQLKSRGFRVRKDIMAVERDLVSRL